MIVITVVLFTSPANNPSQLAGPFAGEEPQYQVSSVYCHEVRVAGPADRDSVL